MILYDFPLFLWLVKSHMIAYISTNPRISFTKLMQGRQAGAIQHQNSLVYENTALKLQQIVLQTPRPSSNWFSLPLHFSFFLDAFLIT